MESQIDRWWEQQNEQLITCPHQPGNLKISAVSCAKRYEMAQQRQRVTRDQDTGLALKATLERCRHCEIGEQQYLRERRDPKRRAAAVGAPVSPTTSHDNGQ